MNIKAYPFSDLTEVELDAILSRARDERAKAITALFAGFRRMVGSAFKRRFGRAQAAQIRTPALLPH